MTARLVLVAVALLVGRAALGATPAPVDPVGALKQRLDELNRTLTEVPAALDTLHDVENRLEHLTHEVERLGQARVGDAEVRRTLDEIRAQLAELDRRVAGALAQPERSTSAVQLGWDEGLYLRGGPVLVVVDAGLQARYTGAIRRAPIPNDSSFDLHHAQLGLQATILEWITVATRFDFGFEYARAGGAAMVRDYYIDLRPLPWLTVRAGQFRVPLGRQRVTSELRETFIERSLATRALTFDRDLGALVEARLLDERLVVQAAVTDGVDTAMLQRNNNLDLAYTARIVAQPLGPLAPVEGDRARSKNLRFSVGAAFQYDLQPTDQTPPLDDLDHNGATDNVEVLTVAVEAALKWRGLAFEGEYFYRREQVGFGRATHDLHGGYAQVSMMIWRGLEGGARVSYAQLPRLRPPPIGLIGDAPLSGLEAGGVVNYYVWNERVKAQLGYAYRRDDNADPFDRRLHDGHVIELQLQAGF